MTYHAATDYHHFSFLCLYAFISYQHCLLLFKSNSAGLKIPIFKYDSLKNLHTVQIWSRMTELT